jgi:hypothetical protein
MDVDSRIEKLIEQIARVHSATTCRIGKMSADDNRYRQLHCGLLEHVM